MDSLLTTVLSRRNVAVLSMQGLERSRFFLRFALNLLAKRPEAKIYHVLDKDKLVERIHLEAKLMPFDQFGPEGISITKLDGNNTGADSRLIICSITHLYQQMPVSEGTTDPNAMNVLLFDVASLESLEGTIIELRPDANLDVSSSLLEFHGRYKATSIVLACNGPLDGCESDLGTKFHNIITKNCLQSQQEGSASFGDECKWPSGDDNRLIGLDDKDSNNRAKLYEHVGSMLEKIASTPSSGRVVVFFPTYGKMVEFHNAWKQLGVFERIGLPFSRENRGGDHFKNSLKDLAVCDRSIFLCSIRYHQDEDLAEMALGQVETFVIVGLPYPIMSDTWAARIKRHDELSGGIDCSQEPVISGTELYKCRAIDFMNGIIKRCLLNGYRSKPCHFLILGELDMRSKYRYKLVKELGDVQVWPQKAYEN